MENEVKTATEEEAEIYGEVGGEEWKKDKNQLEMA